MDQQISIKKIFNYCFSSPQIRVKSKNKDHSEDCQNTISCNNLNGPDSELKTGTRKKSSFYKLKSKHNATLTRSFSKDYKEIVIKQERKKKKISFSCFKRNSSTDETKETVKKKEDLQTVCQSCHRIDNAMGKEVISCSKPSTSRAQETKASQHYSHDSVIELMSKDGTLKLYSATTLTPLSSVAVHDEDRIQTHLSISCFQPEEHLQGYSSDGPDDVFESSDEASNRLAFHFQNLEIVQRCGKSNSGIYQSKRHRMTDSKREHPDKEENYSLLSNGVDQRLPDSSQINIADKENFVPTDCPCLESVNYISRNPYFERHSYNDPRPFTSEVTNHSPSNFQRTRSVYQNQDDHAHSEHSCVSFTNHIPPVKKWILQMYFNSMVVDDENLYGYGNIHHSTEGIDNMYSSSHVYYTQQNDPRIFSKAALQEQNRQEASARDCVETNYNADFHTYQSNVPSALIREDCGNRNSERRKLKMERKKYKAENVGRSKKNDGDFYKQKENLSRTKSAPTAETSQNRIKRPFRKIFCSSKPPVFPQDATYTYYSFIDGPLATNNEENNLDW